LIQILVLGFGFRVWIKVLVLNFGLGFGFRIWIKVLVLDFRLGFGLWF
jgi:hypothetical protein